MNEPGIVTIPFPRRTAWIACAIRSSDDRAEEWSGYRGIGAGRMDGGYQLRAATNADATAVRHLVFSVLLEHGFAPDPGGIDADLDDLESSYFRRGGWFDVATDAEGTVVGTVGLYPLGEGCCELRKMYLAPQARGRGLGRRLLDQALERARALGFRRIELETASTLEAAARLYESTGFRPFVPEHRADRCDRAYYLELGEPAPP